MGVAGGYRPYIGLGREVRANFTGLNRVIRQNQVVLATVPRRLKRANEASVEWLTQAALLELQGRIATTGRRQEQPRNLERVVGNKDLTSTWDSDGFQWFKSSKVNRTNVRRYWRVIEKGSSYWVERSARTGEGLIFRGGPGRGAGTSEVTVIRPTSGPDPAGSRRRGRRLGAPILNPIPAYRYLETAAARFTAEKVYSRYLTDALKGTPIRVKRDVTR